MVGTINALEVAKTLYEEAFVEDKVSPTLTEEELKRLYCEKKAIVKMTMFNGNLQERLNRLAIGYSYLLNVLNHPKSYIDVAFLEYENLVFIISQYGFKERDKKTTGQSQNNAQYEIMVLVHQFDEIMAQVKKFFLEHEDLLESKKEEIEELTCMMQEEMTLINEAGLVYRNNLMTYRNHGNDAHFVGECRLSWRKEKNRGLQLVMTFVKQMVEIYEKVLKEVNKSNRIRIKDYSGIPVNVLYWNNINRIQRSSVYYSFLSDQEKKDVEKLKKLF